MYLFLQFGLFILFLLVFLYNRIKIISFYNFYLTCNKLYVTLSRVLYIQIQKCL